MDFYGPVGFGGWVGHAVMTVVSGLFALASLLVVIGLLFLFVRFLLVATRAAHLYVAKNSPPAPAVTTTTAPLATSTVVTAVKPTSTRPPKTPPAT